MAYGNTPTFQAQIDDLRLKFSMLEENAKNRITGRKIAWKRPKISLTGGPWIKISLIHVAKTDKFN